MSAPAVEATEPTSENLLDVQNLTVTVSGRDWHANAVDDVSFSVKPNKILGIVGESGSGKSLTALALMGLLEPPVARTQGAAFLNGRDLFSLRPRELHRLRGSEMSIVFQEPTTSLDNAFTIGAQVTETIRAHRSMSRADAKRLAVEWLGRVGIASAEKRFRAYPYEFSGGMRQRVMIAMALVLHPRLLILDEPTTALDVTTQAQILELIVELKQELQIGAILISHDLGMVLDVADRVLVMYAGQVCELATAENAARAPRHPYTQGLLRTNLHLMRSQDSVPVIAGQIPGLQSRPEGCRFAPRCPYVLDGCRSAEPALRPTGNGALLRCINPSPWTP
jgi:peptide/nickel transport system ATP-binding protein